MFMAKFNLPLKYACKKRKKERYREIVLEKSRELYTIFLTEIISGWWIFQWYFSYCLLCFKIGFLKFTYVHLVVYSDFFVLFPPKSKYSVIKKSAVVIHKSSIDNDLVPHRGWRRNDLFIF